ncbi:MAG: 4-hydroxy-tetrahydrodipicolinate reductase [Deltaproteobacteria bacterium]|nr:4-hydroxy-tetrahydrodipicolinate reductase [Candidatus Anaeroferrophillus wilburensis]MBN2888115.1 4-hydroxy-tetrahydrodipicolinate reductase [Deltaproteobacteria bacterium]
MTKIMVSGATGRMGRRIISVIDEHEQATLAGALEFAGNPLVGRDAGEVAGVGALGVAIVGEVEKLPFADADVLIEFTSPEATLAHLELAAGYGVPMVIGTTGITAAERQQIAAFARQVPLVVAPNMSVGVNVLFKVVADVARILGDDFDVEILEAHHRLKKDAPSGTAVRLGEIVAESLGRDIEKVAVYERLGFTGERTREEIGMQTLRAGDIVGDHLVLFGGLGERLEIVHRAHSRDTFARGAVRAALWVSSQAPGLYDMQDVLGLKD